MENLHEHHKFVVDSGQSPIRIDLFLLDKLADISRTLIQKAAKANSIVVNNKPVKANYKVKPNDVIAIMMTYPKTEYILEAEDIPINIVYEDDDLLVVNKEAGMVVHPAVGNRTGTLIHALLHHLRDLPLFQNDNERPGLVHRLDKDTSGLLVIAKNEFAKAHLAKQFFDRTTHRRYNALVWGTLDEKEGTIEGNIGRSIKDRKVMQVFPDGDYGKHAITHYKILKEFTYITMIECRLETGRTHQIRAHMRHIGHPIFNDREYGGDMILKGTTFTKYKQFVQNCFKELPRQALHAKTLGFTHPKTGEKMMFNSELPPDMQNVIGKWEKYTGGRE